MHGRHDAVVLSSPTDVSELLHSSQTSGEVGHEMQPRDVQGMHATEPPPSSKPKKPSGLQTRQRSGSSLSQCAHPTGH